MRGVRDVLRLKAEVRFSDWQIAAVLGTACSTVREYLRPPRDARLGWPLCSEFAGDTVLAVSATGGVHAAAMRAALIVSRRGRASCGVAPISLVRAFVHRMSLRWSSGARTVGSCGLHCPEAPSPAP